MLENCLYSATPISSPGCEYAFGIYPDSAECSTSYLKCAYGEPHQQQCDAGLAYDERIHGCNWPDQLLHICNPEGNLQQTEAIAIILSLNVFPNLFIAAVVGFTCPTKISGQSARFWPFPRFAIPGDRHHLITCVDGHPRLISCGDSSIFNEDSLTCEEL